MSKRIDFSQAAPADNPFASALSSALASSGLELRESAQGIADIESEQAPRARGTLELRLERRNGKPTTVIFTQQIEHADSVAWAAELKGTIVLQGDVRVKVEAWSTEKGLKFKRVGG
jgi:translation initiation factor 1 (eIF-1/SUI1)